MLGVPGLMRAWRSGRVALVNAPGAGIADDKKVYSYVPDIIRFFLDEEPILATVPTLRCSDEESRQFVLGNLDDLVVKPANESGGYGVAGRHPGHRAPSSPRWPSGSRTSRTRWVAQPMHPPVDRPDPVRRRRRPPPRGPPPLHPARPGGGLCHPGGLTRVARRAGSLVVNSSQGGGSKDTWVVDAPVATEPRRATRGRRPRVEGDDRR